MKVVKYPKWKKKHTCECGTTYIITSKDVIPLGLLMFKKYIKSRHARFY